MNDPYGVLGVRRNATFEQIKAAYRRLAKTCHPDHFPDDAEKAAEFVRLTEAYEALRKRNRTMPQQEASTGQGASTGDIVVRSHRLTLMLWCLQAPAGMGKTRGWAEAVARPFSDGPAALFDTTFVWPPRRPHRIIIASPTINLMEQTARDLRQWLARNLLFEIVDNQEVYGPNFRTYKATRLY